MLYRWGEQSSGHVVCLERSSASILMRVQMIHQSADISVLFPPVCLSVGLVIFLIKSLPLNQRKIQPSFHSFSYDLTQNRKWGIFCNLSDLLHKYNFMCDPQSSAAHGWRLLKIWILVVAQQLVWCLLFTQSGSERYVRVVTLVTIMCHILRRSYVNI